MHVDVVDDAGLVSLGAVAAALWEINEGLVALTLLPLALAYRSLAIPGLVEATRIEPKTGLYNMPLPSCTTRLRPPCFAISSARSARLSMARSFSATAA